MRRRESIELCYMYVPRKHAFFSYPTAFYTLSPCCLIHFIYLTAFYTLLSFSVQKEVR